MEALQAAPTSPPRTYSEWSAWIDMFETGTCDSDLLRLARATAPTWRDGVAQLFGTRLYEAMGRRLNRIGTAMAGRLKDCRNESGLALVVVQCRQEFATLRRFAELDCLQGALRTQLAELIQHHLDTRQASLEQGARADRSGRIALALRRNPLNRPAGSPTETESPASPAPGGRRIIIA